MTRALLAAAALSVLAAGAIAAAQPSDVQLSVSPMSAPIPALKYLLLPDPGDVKSGNAAQEYLRCFAEQRVFFFSTEFTEKRHAYLSMPLAELAKEKTGVYGGRALTQADRAARMDTVDWQTFRDGPGDGADLALPELGPLRILAEALQARCRIEIASGRFDDAVRTAATMIALARHLSEYPAGAANLVGLSIADRALASAEEMVQQPNCPNLYWALTDLPRPLIELRKGLRGDCARMTAEMAAIRADAPMTAEQLEDVISRLSGRTAFQREQAGQAPRGLRSGLKARSGDRDKVRAGCDWLVKSGCAWYVAAFLPSRQIILLDARREYEILRDERLKLLGVALWRGDAAAGGQPNRSKDALFADLLPPVDEYRRAQGRLDQRVALLRQVEALRLFAAAHDGRLPAGLAEIEAPMPDDPFTGKPFIYEMNGVSARLRGGSQTGAAKADTIRYEISIRK
jgi:hypothetical protein